jgi:amidophosphoribosyltransferase
MGRIEGAYSLILMSPSKLLAAREPHGFRPLCIGEKSDGAIVFASESCALDAVGARFVRDILPGEIVAAGPEGIRTIRTHCGEMPRSLCVFEYIYFARPDSVLEGCPVSRWRQEAGRRLAKTHPVDADVVVGVPDSGLDAAIGYADASGIPYRIGLVKNKYIARTFIAPSQEQRAGMVRLKLNPVREVVEGKRVVLVDDSIVRGTTSAQLAGLVRGAGAAEVHLRICAPPFLHACYYGTDIDSEDNLIAVNHTVEETARIIGVDSLGYLSVEDAGRIYVSGGGLCRACFDGCYPTAVPFVSSKNRFELPIGG